jgi:hypothetical protein
MDANLTDKVQQLATEFATQAKTLDDLNSFIKLTMKSALGRMLDTELGCPSRTQAIARFDDRFSDSSGGGLCYPGTYEEKCEKSSQWAFAIDGTRRSQGEIRLITPRDCDGIFESQLISKITNAA